MKTAVERKDVTLFRDPGVHAGPLRILPRTTCHWCILDDRRPMADPVFISQHQSLRHDSEGWREAVFALVTLARIEGFEVEGVSEAALSTYGAKA